MRARKLNESNFCEVDSCTGVADSMVYSRSLEKVIICCDTCADEVIDEGVPEYWDTCDNCGCRLPIN